MKLIEIRAEYTILFEEKPHLPEKGKVAFLVPVTPQVTARINLSFANKLVEIGIEKYPISDELLELLIENLNYEKIKKDYKDEILKIHSRLSVATEHLLSLIKYHLAYVDISEQSFSVKSKHWRIDGRDWRHVPSSIHMVADMKAVPNFDVRTCRQIQESLNKGITLQR